MNAIASLGRRVIERVRGIGTATLMLLQVILSLPTWLGVRLFIYQMYRVGVMSLLIIVVVTMDFMSQVQAYVMSHQYESLLKKANFKGSPVLK